MTNTKNTKRALLSSVLALFLCFAMLLGTTYAWFTDSVTSANNVIKSGNLDIALDYWDGNSWETVEGTNSLFTNNLWEPGHTEVVYLKLSNLGSLALKYQLAISVLSETEGTNMAGYPFKLSDYIQMGVVEGINGETNSYADRATAVEAVKDASGIIGDGYAKQGEMLADADELYMAVVVYMPENVGNEANAKTGTDVPTINLGVQVLATQTTAESDGFDNQYDEGATFGTYIELEADADLLAAMASAKADMPLTIKLNGDVKWPTEGHRGENDITPASSIVIDGNGYTITATGSGVTPLGDQTAPMTLKNVKIVDNSVSYNEGAWELTYLEMGGTRLTCENVTFADEIQTGTNATFTNCSFESNEESVYAVWVEDGSATFTGCTFTGYRGLKMHEDYGTEISSVIVKDCTFSDITKKPGIAIGTLNADTTVSITGSTFINCQAGDQGIFMYETDTDVDTINFTENNNIVKVIDLAIATAEELFAFAKDVNENGNTYSGKTVALVADIDLNDQSWTPIGQTRVSSFQGTFDGQGHTIKNMTVNYTGTNSNYACGLFGWIELHNDAPIVIQNVKFDNANVTGIKYTGVVAGYANGASGAEIKNCVVTNSTVTSNSKNAGGIIGYMGKGVLTGNTVSGCTISAKYDVGGIANSVEPAVTFQNNKVENTKIYYEEDQSYDAAGIFTGGKVVYRDDNNKTTFVPDSTNTNSNVTVNKVAMFISTAEELFAFAKSVNEENNSYAGKIVLLTADIDLENKAWTPIGQTGATQFMGTFDGQNHTIKNLKIDSSAQTGANYSSGLFGWLNNATVKNVTIENATVTGNHNVGVIAGYMETSGCTISNCHVIDATVVAKHANDDACGDKVGVIVGHAGNAGVKVENCTAENCTVTAGRDAGQIAGAALTANVTGCIATNVTVTAGGNCTGANINESVIGRVM